MNSESGGFEIGGGYGPFLQEARGQFTTAPPPRKRRAPPAGTPTEERDWQRWIDQMKAGRMMH
jgi:hypothetical protein